MSDFIFIKGLLIAPFEEYFSLLLGFIHDKTNNKW